MLTGIEGFRTFNLGERNSVFEITVQMTDKSDGIPKGLNVGLYPYYSINVMGFQFGFNYFKKKNYPFGCFEPFYEAERHLAAVIPILFFIRS